MRPTGDWKFKEVLNLNVLFGVDILCWSPTGEN